MTEEEPWRPDLARKAERVIAQERTSYRRLFTHLHDLIESGEDAGCWGLDAAAAEPSEAAKAGRDWAVQHVLRLAVATDDAAQALWLMMRHDQLLFVPALSVTRQILEAVLQTCWLMEASVFPEQRIARAAALRPSYLDEQIPLLRRFNADKDAEVVAQVRRELVRLMRRDGLTVYMVTDKQGNETEEVGRVEYRGASASTRLNMTSLLERRFVDRDRWLYSLLSGSAHAKGWFMEGPPEDADEGVRAIMLPLLQISEVYTRTYFGVDETPYRKARGVRRMALMRTGSPTVQPDILETAFGVRERRLIGD